MSTERNIKIRIVTTDELPATVPACCAKDGGTDNYIMLINGRDDERAQLRSFLHECLHIWHRDHDSSEDVQTIEKERHKELEKLLAAMV